MIRTQVYLSTRQMQALKGLAARSGKRQSELIREAIDLFTARNEVSDWREAARPAAGLWRDRSDLPDFRAVREELDRKPGSGQ